MKRIQTFIALCFVSLCCCRLTAQPVPISGDTIYGRDSLHYHYEWWSEEYLGDSNAKLQPYPYLYDSDRYIHFLAYTRGEILQFQYVEKNLTIVGLAAAHCWQYACGGHTFYPNIIGYDHEPDSAEYLYLYDCIRDSFQLLRQVQWHNSDPHRYLHVDMRGVDPYNTVYITELCDMQNFLTELDIPIYEYYFDSPVTVSDSFYVGFSQWSLYRYHDTVLPRGPMPYHNVGRVFTLQYEGNNNPSIADKPCPLFPRFRYRFRGENLGILDPVIMTDSTWTWIDANSYLLVFPIISYDTVATPPPYQCPTVENFRVGQYNDGCAVLLWNTNSEHHSWQVSYGADGTLPDDGILVNCPIQVTQICGLDSGQRYVAYIRAVCEHDSTLVYSDWSDGIVLDPAGTEGIDPADASFTTLIPNPATDLVQVVSALPFVRIEVYDMKGIRMLDLPAVGTTATFNVGGWPSDLYIVVVHSSVGNVTRKLIVR